MNVQVTEKQRKFGQVPLVSASLVSLLVACSVEPSSCAKTATCPAEDVDSGTPAVEQEDASTGVTPAEETTSNGSEEDAAASNPAEDHGESMLDAGTGTDVDAAETPAQMVPNINLPSLSSPDSGMLSADASTPLDSPCEVNNGDCDPLALCNYDTAQGVVCGICPAGYQGNGTDGCTPLLTGLDLSTGTLNQTFNPAVMEYSVTLPLGTQYLTLDLGIPEGAVASVDGGQLLSTSWESPPLPLGESEWHIRLDHPSGEATTEYVLTVTRGLEPAVLTASNADPLDDFGFSLDLSADGSTLAVGAHFESSSSAGVNSSPNDDAGEAGAVYVFEKSGSRWLETAYLKASNPAGGDRFGWQVALSADGNTLAISAYAEDSGATGINGDQTDNSAIQAGAVYVFQRSDTTWTQQAYLKASNTEEDDRFGWWLDLSDDGKTLVAGAYGEDSAASNVGGDQGDNSLELAGAAYVFVEQGNTWIQQAYLKSPSPEADSLFGSRVSISGEGNTVAIVAAIETGGSQSGATYLFERNGSAWIPGREILTPPTIDAAKFSGDGQTLAIGTPLGEGSLGTVQIFTRRDDGWDEEVTIRAPHPDLEDYFGRSLALNHDGTRILLGSIYEDSSAPLLGGDQTDNSLTDSGAGYLFDKTEAGWRQTGYIKPPEPLQSDRFGWAAALSADGSTAVLSGLKSSHAAFVFE